MSIKQTSAIQKKETSKAFIEKEVAELLKKLSTHQSELETQNEELRTMQQKLEEVRDQYTNLFEFAPVGYFIFDLKGTILNVNLTGSGMLNSERVRVKGKSFTAFLANNNDNYLFFKHLREVFKTEVLHSCQVELKRKGYPSFPAH
ncbi:MAG: PAS domain-containing protein, partial [Bacteroidetes bacterium]|nr:PAS domain-containing protein [Bacteroidota bacterium]